MQKRTIYVILLLGHFCALSLFFFSFFQVAPESVAHVVLHRPYSYPKSESKGKFQRMIWMVIDALSSDAIFSPENTYMPFTSKLIQDSQHAMRFNVKAFSPTVTLPCFKTMTAGVRPTFADMFTNVFLDIENNAATKPNVTVEDSLIVRLKLAGHKIVLYGDETLIQLNQPRDVFFEKRSELVEGSFVTDYISVDTQVSDKLDFELSNSQEEKWDILFLHYAGIDHIGHVGKNNFRYSAQQEKLKQMDEVIKKIYASLESDTLFVISSDHGMNSIGNHGGATPGETRSFAIFVQKQHEFNVDFTRGFNEMEYKSRVFNQMDLVPTIALLLGVPVPRNNIGTVMLPLLRALNMNKQLDKLIDTNVQQLMQRMLFPNSSATSVTITKEPEVLSWSLYNNEQKDNVKILLNRYLDKIQTSKSPEDKYSFAKEISSFMSKHYKFLDPFGVYLGMFGLITSALAMLVTFIVYERVTLSKYTLGLVLVGLCAASRNGFMMYPGSFLITSSAGIAMLVAMVITTTFSTAICVENSLKVLQKLHFSFNLTRVLLYGGIFLFSVLTNFAVMFEAQQYYWFSLATVITIAMIIFFHRNGASIVPCFLQLWIIFFSQFYIIYDVREEYPPYIDLSSHLKNMHTGEEHQSIIGKIFYAVILIIQLIDYQSIFSFTTSRGKKVFMALMLPVTYAWVIMAKNPDICNYFNVPSTLFAQVALVLLVIQLVFVLTACRKEHNVVGYRIFTLYLCLMFLMHKMYMAPVLFCWYLLASCAVITRAFCMHHHANNNSSTTFLSTHLDVLMYTLLLAWTAYYSLGYSISTVASIDFSGAYVASNSFQLVVIGTFIYLLYFGFYIMFNWGVYELLCSYAGSPIQTIIAASTSSLKGSDLATAENWNRFMEWCYFHSSYVTLLVAGLSISVFMNLDHNSIWTLISPTFFLVFFIDLMHLITTVIRTVVACWQYN